MGSGTRTRGTHGAEGCRTSAPLPSGSPARGRALPHDTARPARHAHERPSPRHPRPPAPSPTPASIPDDRVTNGRRCHHRRWCLVPTPPPTTAAPQGEPRPSPRPPPPGARRGHRWRGSPGAPGGRQPPRQGAPRPLHARDRPRSRRPRQTRETVPVKPSRPASPPCLESSALGHRAWGGTSPRRVSVCGLTIACRRPPIASARASLRLSAAPEAWR